MYRTLIIATGLFVLVGCTTTGERENNGIPYEQQSLATEAANVLQKQAQQPENNRIPSALINGAKCIAVFPSVKQAAFIIGGQHGDGVISCRKSGVQGWSDAAPAFYSLSGGSIGLQAGVKSTSLILLFLTQDSVNKILRGNFKFGADLGIVAGPVGYNANIESAPAPVVSYQTSGGVFAGVSINGSKMSFDEQANQNVYGDQISEPRTVLFEIDRIPASVDSFNRELEQFARPTQKEMTR